MSENPTFAIIRTIYDPALKDFIFDSGDSKALPNIKNWINDHNPAIYWFILRIDNLTDNDISQWAVELYTHQALSITEAYVDGIDCSSNLKKKERDAWSDKWVLSIPRQKGIPIVGKGTRRLYFKVDINCKEGLMHQYCFSGIFMAQGMKDVEIKEKVFQYSCKVGEFKQIFDHNPDEASVYAENYLKGRYSTNSIHIFTNSFRMIHELSRYCHSGSVEQDLLLQKLRLLHANFEKVPEITGQRIMPLIKNEIYQLEAIKSKATLTPDIMRLCDSLVELLHIEVMNAATTQSKEDAERIEREGRKERLEEIGLKEREKERERFRMQKEEEHSKREKEEQDRKEIEEAIKMEREKQKAKQEEERIKIQKEEQTRRENERKAREDQERLKAEEEEREIKLREEQAREKTERKEKEECYESQEIPKTYTNSIRMEFTLIPTGEFMMGSVSSDDEPVHHVKISKRFYLGIYPVTQREWTEVMGNNPSHFKGDNLPVESISWNDVQEFIKKLNKKEGKNKYRLPSEAEWEYAARAGTTTQYSFGDDTSMLGDFAWYDDNSGGKTHEVGQKKPNLFGLYDMHGNVWEWVQDIYHSDYNGAPTDGSAWERDGSGRVDRGGSWYDSAVLLRSASRYCGDVHEDFYNRPNALSFRLLRVL